MGLTRLAIKRPVAIIMLIAALCVLGLQGFSRMPAELNPRIDFPYVSVFTTYPGAGPQEIETLISKPVEDAVGSVNGVKNITSVSQQGVSVVSIEFYLGTNLDVAASDVREKVDGVRRTLPEDAQAPTISKANTSSEPIMYLVMRSTGGRSSRDLRDLADNVVKDRLGQVPGVASIFITGGDVREVQVALNRDRLDAYGLTLSEVAQALRVQNLNVPSGRVTEGNRDYAVRVVGEFATVDEIRDLRLNFPGKNSAPDKTLRLSDLGTVTDTVFERTANATIAERPEGDIGARRAAPLPKGGDTVSLVVQKTSEGNTVEAAEGVKKQLEAVKNILPRDIRFTVTSDQSVRVHENLADVEVSIAIGAFLAVTIVFLFLHNIRGTFIVALAIPTSIVATFLVMYSLGFTLNTMTLLGLSLAVGILVDDSIVVLENIYRHLAMGETPEQAAINGRSEIGLAAVMITLVDVVVFVPIAFMGGIVGQFFRSFGVTVAVATLFSLLVSFTLAPMLASRWYKAGENVEDTSSRFFGAINRFYRWLDLKYENALGWALKHRGTVIFSGNMALVLVILWIAGAGKGAGMLPVAVRLGLMLLVGGALIAGFNLLRETRRARRPGGRPARFNPEPLITAGAAAVAVFLVILASGRFGKPFGFRFAPGQDQAQVALTVELPAGASLAATTRVLNQVEDRVRDIPEVKFIETSAGSSRAGGFQGGGSTGTQYGQIRLTLTDKEGNLDRILFWKDRSALRKRSDVDVAEQVRARVKDIAGAQIRTTEVSGFGGAAAPVQIEVVGPDLPELVRVSNAMQETLRKIPGVLSPDTSYDAARPEVQVILDRERAASFGFSVQQVSQALRDAIEGNIDAKFRSGGEEYDIRVQYDRLNRAAVSDVGSVVIGTRGGQPIRVSDVAKTIEGRGPTKIDRKNRQRQIVVSAYLAPGKVIGNMQLVIEPEIKKIALGRAQYRWGGEANTQAEEFPFLFAALGLAILLVYMLMAALFNNVLYPFIIMLTIPQALVGGLLGLIVTNTPGSIIAMIGVIMLMGLVTKNAILLVDFTNTLRARGLSREDALRQAGPTRLRPILMTTLAQILGTLPVAMALGRGAEFRAPLGIVVIGGLLLSSLLTLLVIPCSYTVFDDISNFFARVLPHRPAGDDDGNGGSGDNGGNGNNGHGGHPVRVPETAGAEPQHTAPKPA